MLVQRHLSKLEPWERVELAKLVRASRGRPTTHLDATQRDELLRLVRKLEPGAFGRSALGAIRSPRIRS